MPSADADKLRESLSLMANLCSAPMKVWNDHANAVLAAADELDHLRLTLPKTEQIK